MAWRAAQPALSAPGSGFRRRQGPPAGEDRLDLLVAERLIVELDAVDALAPIHRVQDPAHRRACADPERPALP